jgi:hypothetical protein
MIFDEIEIQYNEVDGFLSNEEFKARASNDEVAEFGYALKRERNDQAYFLYMFSKLENQIVENTNQLFIDREAAAVDEKDKTVWKLARQKKLDLMERVSFLTPSGNVNYKKVFDLKKKRDSVAHGKYATGVNIPTVIGEFKYLAGILVY